MLNMARDDLGSQVSGDEIYEFYEFSARSTGSGCRLDLLKSICDHHYEGNDEADDDDYYRYDDDYLYCYHIFLRVLQRRLHCCASR